MEDEVSKKVALSAQENTSPSSATASQPETVIKLQDVNTSSRKSSSASSRKHVKHTTTRSYSQQQWRTSKEMGAKNPPNSTENKRTKNQDFNTRSLQIHNLLALDSLDSKVGDQEKLLQHRTGAKTLNRLTIEAILKSDHLDSEGNEKMGVIPEVSESHEQTFVMKTNRESSPVQSLRQTQMPHCRSLKDNSNSLREQMKD